MDVSLKVTDQPQESSLYDLLAGDNVLSIPLFQRPYRWGQRNLDWLFADIDDVSAGVTKSCFLGVVVCVSRGASPGRPLPWEIVDGQQRLSTLYLLLLAGVAVGAEKGAHEWAAGVCGTYLLVRPLSDNPTNTKLVPSFADRAQFKSIWDEIALNAGLMQHPSMVANPPRPPAPTGVDDGPLRKQYVRIRTRLRKLWQESGKSAVDSVVSVAANSLSVVSISLRDPLVAPKIFERLNNRAELVTTADLVRNEVFALASHDPTAAQHVFSNLWEPFIARFTAAKTDLEKFLFPYGLILDRTLTKADLFSRIRQHWASLGSPAGIIADMEKYLSAFLSLEAGVEDQSAPPALRLRLDRIHRLGRPSSTYAFLMRVVTEVKAGTLPLERATEVLDAIESFLFRRAIAGIEPTGLHAVFKGLWHELTTSEDGTAPGVTAESVRTAVGAKTTVAWPTDIEFTNAVRTGNLYKRKVCQYALRELEDAVEGESPTDSFQIEHIAPQTSTPEWEAVLGDVYQAVVDTWANLVPLTPRMNGDLGQLPFVEKRAEYEDSIFATTRGISGGYTTWAPSDINRRASEIASWALTRWPATGL